MFKESLLRNIEFPLEVDIRGRATLDQAGVTSRFKMEPICSGKYSAEIPNFVHPAFPEELSGTIPSEE